MTNIGINNEWAKIPGDWDFDYFINKDGLVRHWWESAAKSKYDKKESRHKFSKAIHYKIGYGAGYYGYRLRSNRKSKTQYTHRLLAITFIPNPQNKAQVNHIDGNGLNNSLCNLEWVTARENINHAWDTGLCGTKINCGRVTPLVVDKVKSLAGTMSQYEIGKVVNLHQSHVSRIINNKVYRSKNQYDNH